MAQSLHIDLYGPFSNLSFGVCAIYFDLKVIIYLSIYIYIQGSRRGDSKSSFVLYDQKPGWLSFRGDYTTHLYWDFNQPLTKHDLIHIYVQKHLQQRRLINLMFFSTFYVWYTSHQSLTWPTAKLMLGRQAFPFEKLPFSPGHSLLFRGL